MASKKKTYEVGDTDRLELPDGKVYEKGDRFTLAIEPNAEKELRRLGILKVVGSRKPKPPKETL